MAGIGGISFNGSDIDNTAAAALAHVVYCCLDEQERGPEIDRHQAIPIALGHFLNRLLEHNAGVVHEDIEATKLLCRFRYESGDLGRASKVCRDGHGVALG